VELKALTKIVFAKGLAISGLVLLPMSASAQSHDFHNSNLRSGSEARVTFKIPLDAKTSNPKSEPRLEFGIRNYNRSTSAETSSWMLKSSELGYKESNFGLTLSEEPRLMLNGELAQFNSEQANLGTAGKIGIGVVVVVVVAAGALYIVLLNAAPFDE